MHPSSLPTEEICGTFGEPSRKWIKLLSENGISVWQFLPLTPTDSFGSPYSSPSSFAINTWFLDANDLVKEGFIPSRIIEDLPKQSTNKNISSIDFNFANLRSNALGKALRKNWHVQSEGRHLEFKEWSTKETWLDNHSSFMELRRQHNGLPWWKWNDSFSSPNNKELKDWKTRNKEGLLEHSLMQWHLSRQWNQLRRLARESGVLLFGDLPFYVSRDSADVWGNRSLFSVSLKGNLSSQSGVPPDYFAETGQLWGTPVYRWQKHKRTRYEWWRKRFNRQWILFDLLRLDHFRGLVAYWSVPGKEKTAQNGCWLPSPGLELLSFLQIDYGENLPLVAEDLGVITKKVDDLRKYFQFPGMKILQFAFDGNENNPYLPENINNYNWIVYTGTHDNSTTIGWWNAIDDDIRRRVLERYHGNSKEPSWKLIELGMKTEAILFVSPIQDILSLGEESRLNKPGTIEGNWSWKLNYFDTTLTSSIKRFGQLSIANGRTFDGIHKAFLDC